MVVSSFLPYYFSFSVTMTVVDEKNTSAFVSLWPVSFSSARCSAPNPQYTQLDTNAVNANAKISFITPPSSVFAGLHVSSQSPHPAGS
jgi:hypothetical protein